MRKILFASNNENKIKEIKHILKGYEVMSLKEAGIDIDVVEDGKTFEENAFLKADTIADLIKKIPEFKGTIVLADDSGIEIDYLNGAPGIYSARWMPGLNDSEVNEEVIKRLESAKPEERTAHYVTVIAGVKPNGQRLVTKGFTYGTITKKQKGTNGFAYDAIFYVPEFDCTMAEMTLEQKNSISHRGIAIIDMKDLLEDEKI